MEETSQRAVTNSTQEQRVPNLEPDLNTKFRLTVEPILLIVFIGSNVSDMVETNLFEERMCLHSGLGQNKSVDCYNMTSTELEQIQPSVADLKMLKTLIEVLVPSVTLLFLGPWTDINGRIPLLLSTIGGKAVTYCMFCVFSTIPELPPVTFLLCSIPVSLTGGEGALLVVSLCYIVDITDHKTRSLRICVMQTFISIGSIVGALISPLLYIKSSTYAFALSTMVTLVGLIYTSLCLKETVLPRTDVNRKMYNLDLVKDTWKCVIKKRTGFLRCIIMLSAVALFLNTVILTGQDLTMYLYLQKQFSWDLQDYTLFDAYSTLIAGTIPVGAFYYLSSKRGIPDMYLALAASAPRIFEKIGFAFSVHKWHFYAIKMFSCVVLISEPLLESQLSKTFHIDDFSKIYTFLKVIDGFGELIGSPLYTTAYGLTIHDFSNFTFFLSALIGTVCFILYFIITCLLSKNDGNYLHLNES